jgi:hypothetical protein
VIRKPTTKRPSKKAVSKTKIDVDHPFKCPFEGCDFQCAKFQGIGGHRSKRHKGLNPDYGAKMLIRARRSDERLALKQAKEQYLEKYGDANVTKIMELKKMKKQILKTMKQNKEIAAPTQ